MSRDESARPTRPSVSRPRPVRRPTLPPGPLRDLKDAVYELYLRAGPVSMVELAAEIRDSDDLPGAPSSDTVHRILNSAARPANVHDVVAVATALARRAALARGERVDLSEVPERIRRLYERVDPGAPAPVPGWV